MPPKQATQSLCLSACTHDRTEGNRVGARRPSRHACRGAGARTRSSSRQVASTRLWQDTRCVRVTIFSLTRAWYRMRACAAAPAQPRRPAQRASPAPSAAMEAARMKSGALAPAVPPAGPSADPHVAATHGTSSRTWPLHSSSIPMAGALAPARRRPVAERLHAMHVAAPGAAAVTAVGRARGCGNDPVRLYGIVKHRCSGQPSASATWMCA